MAESIWLSLELAKLSTSLFHFLSRLTGCNAIASLRDEWKKKILEAWDARDTAHKFQVVCMIHNAADTYWEKGVLPELARRGTIRMLSISHQCVIPLHLLVNLSDVFNIYT